MLDERTLARIHGCVGPAVLCSDRGAGRVHVARWWPDASREQRALAWRRVAAAGGCSPRRRLCAIGARLARAAFAGRSDAGRVSAGTWCFICSWPALLTFHVGVAGRCALSRRLPASVASRVPAIALVGSGLLQIGLGAATWVDELRLAGVGFADYAWAAGYTVVAQKSRAGPCHHSARRHRLADPGDVAIAWRCDLMRAACRRRS